MSAARADIRLSTGRIIEHHRLSNGAQEARVKGEPLAPLTDDEWIELEAIYDKEETAKSEADAKAAELGKAAGARWANKRLKMRAPVGRLEVANTAGRSHMSAWDSGKVKGATDVVPYGKAFIEAVFAVLEPAGLIVL